MKCTCVHGYHTCLEMTPVASRKSPPPRWHRIPAAAHCILTMSPYVVAKRHQQQQNTLPTHVAARPCGYGRDLRSQSSNVIQVLLLMLLCGLPHQRTSRLCFGHSAHARPHRPDRLITPAATTTATINESNTFQWSMCRPYALKPRSPAAATQYHHNRHMTHATPRAEHAHTVRPVPLSRRARTPHPPCHRHRRVLRCRRYRGAPPFASFHSSASASR